MMSAVGEMKSALAKGTIDVATMETAIKQYNANLAETYAKAALATSGKQLNETEAKAIGQRVQQTWENMEYDNAKKNAEIKKIMNEAASSSYEHDNTANALIEKLIPMSIIPMTSLLPKPARVVEHYHSN